jgi:5-methylcytosine-specific restriction endonuclease McrA
LKHKKIENGELFDSKYWGEFEVIDASDQKNIVIKFLNTGNTRTARKIDILKGNICDREAFDNGVQITGYTHPTKQSSIIPAGQQFKSNLYGMVEVVQYNTSKDILIKFLDTGNIQSVQKHALLKGLMHDLKLKTDRVESKRNEKLQHKIAKERQLEEERRLKVLEKEKKEIEEKLRKKEAEEKIKAQRESRLIGYTSKDRLGHEFTVIAHARGERSWIVKYTESGNEYEVMEGWMVKGAIGDFGRGDYEDLMKVYRARQAALNYEKNREKRVQQATTYQKVNIDRTRVRNRNRRARRVKAEGSHTLEETLELLDKQDYKCNCCGEDIHEKRHLDHIMPLSLGGSNWIENLQWLCPFCNSSKSDKHPDEWDKYISSDVYLSRLKIRKSSAQSILQ